MSLLDFSEIPPSKSPSSDVDAFEKFAREFFVTLFDAKVVKDAGRGPDGGADLVLEVQGERWLVSCKHYKNSVPPHERETPYGDMQQWGCQQYIGFYSPGPSTGLEAKLRQTRDNNPGFRFQIFDSTKIQNHLISAGSAEAWLLAFRWFPNSFAKIASSLVRPLVQYSRDDVLTDERHAWINGIPIYSPHAADDIRSQEAAADGLVNIANELATDKAFSPIFTERAKDFSLVVPGAFVRPTYINDCDVRAHELYPSWNLDLVRELCERQCRGGLVSLCRVWSFWDLNMAETIYFYGRNLMDADENERFTEEPVTMDALDSLVASHRYTWRFRSRAQELSLSNTGRDCSTTERGFFAALLCYRPGTLHAFVPPQEALYRLAVAANEEPALSAALYKLASGFSEDDNKYVIAKSPNLFQLLTSVNLIDTDYLPKLMAIDPTLTCVSASRVEVWRPNGQVKQEIADALGFQP